jgi:hypothetical protein
VCLYLDPSTIFSTCPYHNALGAACLSCTGKEQGRLGLAVGPCRKLHPDAPFRGLCRSLLSRSLSLFNNSPLVHTHRRAEVACGNLSFSSVAYVVCRLIFFYKATVFMSNDQYSGDIEKGAPLSGSAFNSSINSSHSTATGNSCVVSESQSAVVPLSISSFAGQPVCFKE